MFKYFFGAVGLVALTVSISAQAFQLPDHEAIARQAFAEFVSCFPQFRGVNVQSLVEGDLDEDLNLIEKELFYSHYYNPYKHLRMWREDSSGRLDSLNADLIQCREDSPAPSSDDVTQLGHAVHHLQDMAVPAHVVPVTHSLWDGFESLKITGEISSGWTCAQIRQAGGVALDAVLRETAQSTLNAVAAMNVRATDEADGSTRKFPGTAFWVEAQDDGFGSYGVLGNAFGASELHQDQKNYRVDPQVFVEFKRAQMKLAVQATLRGLVWTLTRPENWTAPARTQMASQ